MRDDPTSISFKKMNMDDEATDGIGIFSDDKMIAWHAIDTTGLGELTARPIGMMNVRQHPDFIKQFEQPTEQEPT